MLNAWWFEHQGGAGLSLTPLAGCAVGQARVDLAGRVCTDEGILPLRGFRLQEQTDPPTDAEVLAAAVKATIDPSLMSAPLRFVAALLDRHEPRRPLSDGTWLVPAGCNEIGARIGARPEVAAGRSTAYGSDTGADRWWRAATHDAIELDDGTVMMLAAGELVCLTGPDAAVWCAADGVGLRDLARRSGWPLDEVRAVGGRLARRGLILTYPQWRLRDGLAWTREESGDYYVLRTGVADAPVALSDWSGVIWELLAERGPQSLEEILFLLTAEYQLDPEAIRGDVVGFLHVLSERGFVTA